MNRLKFLLFTVIVLVVGVGQLLLPARIWSTRENGAAADRLRASQRALAQTFEQRRQELHWIALRAASLPAVSAALHGAVTPERFSALRQEISALLPERERERFFLGVVTDAATWGAVGKGEPTREGLNGESLLQVSAEGGVGFLFGESRLVQSASVPAEKGDKPLGHLILGAPLFSEVELSGVANGQGILAAGLLERGKVSMQAGAEAKQLSEALKVLGPGTTDVVSSGALKRFGPFQLPLFTRGDVFGGDAPLVRGSRFALEGTPMEGVVLLSAREDLSALADVQWNALFSLFGLTVIAFGFAFWLKNTDPQALLEKTSAEHTSEDGTLPLQGPPPAEASPDDFNFPGHPPEPAEPEEPAPPGSGELLPFEPPPRDEPATEALPMMPQLAQAQAASMAGASPFDDLSPPSSQPSASQEPEFNPEATRVALVSKDLLLASSQPAAAPMAPQLTQTVPASSLAVAPGIEPSSEDAHYQEVYREFVATRERCGEPADGLTFEKFAQKLRKNRDQLVQKYACRSVRFQVYVKEGRAALKATPVKD